MRFASQAIIFGLIVFVSAASAQKPDESSMKDPPPDPTSIGGKSLREWREELTKQDASRRAQAIMAIMQFGESASRAVPDILARLEDTDVSPRAKALLALRTIPVEEKAIPEIVRAVSKRLYVQYEGQAVVRLDALLTLGRFVNDGVPAVPALINATMDKASWEIRHTSIGLLWRIGLDTQKDNQPDQRITEALLTCLRTAKTYQEKLETIQGLGAMGRPPNPSLQAKVISELQLCTNTRDPRNRPITIWAYAGLAAMQDGDAADASLATLAKFLKNQDLDTRVQAAMALGAIRGKAKKRVPALLTMLADKEPYAVQAACTALGLVGETGDSVVDALVEMLRHKDPNVAGSAVHALVQLKQNNGRVHGAFDKLRENKDLDYRLRGLIEEAIKELKKPSKK